MIPCPQCQGAPENWRPIPGYEGAYDVSDHGHVRSLQRLVVYPGGITKIVLGRDLVASLTGGYYCLGLYRLGRARTTPVHQVVAVTFIGPRPPGQQVRHWDDVVAHNHRGNLLYGTRSENEQDKIRNYDRRARWAALRAIAEDQARTEL
jgi:hypothetical protein